jgi:phosphoribosylanthranilate isomerase
MTRPDLFVKICGITRAEDADLAADLGASAIGFIFWPGSPRHVTPEQARQIVRRKRAGVKAVGVFVDETLERVREVVDTAALDMVQLHGREASSMARACSDHLAERTVDSRVIKAVSLDSGGNVDVSGYDEDVLILLDAHDPARHGGTGRTIDWTAARRVAERRRTILSGGLTPENVERALAVVSPYGIDVSSGIESSPGVKDAERTKRLFEALNG